MKQIRLSQGLFALVDDEDFEYLSKHNWVASQESRKTKWYAIRFETVNGKRRKLRMHVEIAKRRYGISSIPDGYVVDHVSHNSLDNRFWDSQHGRQQLEIITQQENMRRSPGWKKKGMKLNEHNRGI